MRIRTIILVLGMLLSIAGCVTTNKTNSAKVGDCVETQVGYVVARCWGTLATLPAIQGWLSHARTTISQPTHSNFSLVPRGLTFGDLPMCRRTRFACTQTPVQ